MRLERLRTELKNRGAQAILLSNPINCRYLSSFSGSFSWLVLTLKEQFILTDSRYWEQAKREAPEFSLFKVDRKIEGSEIGALKQLFLELSFQENTKVCWEEKNLSFSTAEKLLKEFKLSWQPGSESLKNLRMIKEPGEIELLRKSTALNDQVFAAIAPKVVPGVTEKQLRAEIHYLMEISGAEYPSFPGIVASGANAALPHYSPEEKVLKAGELVVIDIGAKVKGYCSDLTRTLLMGEVPEKAKEIYQVVKTAQQRAIALIKPGVSCGEIDAAARGYIEEQGYGEYFGHNLGHGVGLEVHEDPGLKPGNLELLQPGMVFTVEPGIYLPGFGGVRIEDIVLVTETGSELLTKAESK